jgi:uncharacterized membrane protein YhaH (DUF805 family)
MGLALQRTSLVRAGPSVPDALLRLWILAELGMAGLYAWLGWGMREWPGDLPGPQPLRSVAITEFIYLFLFVPAAVVVAMRWRARRDRLLAGLAFFYGLASAASFAAWAQADTAGMMRALFHADAVISLCGIPVAVRALALPAGGEHADAGLRR